MFQMLCVRSLKLLFICSLLWQHSNAVKILPYVLSQDLSDDQLPSLPPAQDISSDDMSHRQTNASITAILSQSDADFPPPTPQYEWGGLYPHETPTRDQKTLDGVWNFRLCPKDDPSKGFRESWYSKPLSTTGEVMAMAVPSSYNDITQDKTIREHIGWAW